MVITSLVIVELSEVKPCFGDHPSDVQHPLSSYTYPTDNSSMLANSRKKPGLSSSLGLVGVRGSEKIRSFCCFSAPMAVISTSTVQAIPLESNVMRFPVFDLFEHLYGTPGSSVLIELFEL
jgi:hypothetical protein